MQIKSVDKKRRKLQIKMRKDKPSVSFQVCEKNVPIAGWSSLA
jgi:hypothetical protein